MAEEGRIEAKYNAHILDLEAHTHDVSQKLRTGEYSVGGGQISNHTFVLTADRFTAFPFMIARPITVDRIGIYVSGAAAGGTKARLGLYADGTNLHPGALVTDYGTVAVDAAILVAITISPAALLAKGLHWLAVVSDAAPTIKTRDFGFPPLGVPTDFGYQNAWWYKDDPASPAYFTALPDPFPTAALTNRKPGGIGLRIAALA